jgi:hypothetical protein
MENRANQLILEKSQLAFDNAKAVVGKNLEKVLKVLGSPYTVSVEYNIP